MSSGDEREDTIKNGDLFKNKKKYEAEEKKTEKGKKTTKKSPKLNRQKIGRMKKHHC